MSNAAYPLSIRVQTTVNHISFLRFLCFFLPQYQRQRIFFLRARAEKGIARRFLRDTLTRAAWLGPSDFWLVRPEHAHESYPGLFFRPPGFSPYIEGGKKGELRDWTNFRIGCVLPIVHTKTHRSISLSTLEAERFQLNDSFPNTPLLKAFSKVSIFCISNLRVSLSVLDDRRNAAKSMRFRTKTR